MAKNTDDSKMNPPYVAFGTFKRFVESLKETAVPSRIDRSVLPKMSGVTQSQLTSALKFLGMISSDGVTNQSLHDIVKAYGSDQWADALGKIINEAYYLIVEDLDIASGTANDLRNDFRKRGNIEGQLLVKSIRFYLKAMEEAKWEISPHFKAPSLPAVNKFKRKKKRQAGLSKPTASDSADDQSITDSEIREQMSGMIRLPVGKNRTVFLPSDLDDADCDAIEASMPLLRTIAKLSKGGDP